MKPLDTKQRSRLGNIASLIGILVNIVLAVGKMLVGALFGVISMLADGLNNLTDCGSSVISILSFKLSAKPADKEHPYGHERIEYVCSLIVAFIILLVAFETAKESVNKIITPSAIEFSFLVISTLITSIVAKCGLYLYYKSTAKRINSEILQAAAADSLTDCISTSVVLLTVLIGKFTSLNIDGYAGILVALFIAWSGIGILRETLSKLIGQAPDAETIEAIKQRVLAHPEVLGVHDLAVYSYGPNKYFASVHVEVDASIDVLISHELVDSIEREFYEQTNILLTGHLDPIVTNDDIVNDLRAKIESYVTTLNTQLSIHDFRMVHGEKRTNVLFDVAVPYDCPIVKTELLSTLQNYVSSVDTKYCCIITIENTI